MSERNSILQQLADQKERSELREFPVVITETLKLTVHVEARDAAEAEEIAQANWNNSEYILDAECFVGAEFAAKAPERKVKSATGPDL